MTEPYAEAMLASYDAVLNELQAEVDVGRGLADLQARLDERHARADAGRGLADREPQTDPRFLTVAEVALIMRISKMTVYRLVHCGELEAIRVGRSYRIPERAVMGYMRDERVQQSTMPWTGPGRSC